MQTEMIATSGMSGVLTMPGMELGQWPTMSWPGSAYFGWALRRDTRLDDSLHASEEGLVLNSGLGIFFLRAGAVLRVERAGLIPWCWRGVLIHHRMARYPGPIGFLPREGSTKEMLLQLKENGYWVLD